MAANANEPASSQRRWGLRYVAGVLIGAVVIGLLLSRRGELAGASQRLAHLSWWWAALALLVEALSLFAYAVLQRVVLAASGARFSLGALYAVTIANDAIALSVPGEPAFSSLYRYRQYRRHGASVAGAGWTILTLLIAQAVAMSLLLFVGVLIALASNVSHVGTGVALVGLVVIVAAGAVLVRRDLLGRVLHALVRVSRRVTGHPRGDLGERVDSTIASVRAIRLERAATLLVVGLALAVWVVDMGCLAVSFLAVRAPVPWQGLLLAYGVAQIVAVIPIAPGGFGLVEGSLAVVLITYGAERVPAVLAVLLYRIISYWLAIAVGWATFGVVAWHDRRRDRVGASATDVDGTVSHPIEPSQEVAPGEPN